MSNMPLKQLNQKHRLVCTLVAQGRTIAEACAFVGLTTGYWEALNRDPLIQEELARRKEEVLERMLEEFTRDPVRAKLKEIVPKAINRIESEIDNEKATPKERLQASDMALSRSGYTDKVPESVQQTSVSLGLSEKLIARVLSHKPPAPQPDHIINGVEIWNKEELEK